MTEDCKEDKVRDGKVDMKTQGTDLAYKMLLSNKREKEYKFKNALSKSFGIAIVNKELAEVPQRWRGKYLIDLLRGKIPSYTGGK